MAFISFFDSCFAFIVTSALSHLCGFITEKFYSFRFGNQKVKVFRHDDVAGNDEVMFDSQLFRYLQEEITSSV